MGLSFDQKIEAMIDYGQALEAVDPTGYGTAGNIAPPEEAFYKWRDDVSLYVMQARRSVLHGINAHGEKEYKKNFENRSLHEDSPEALEARAKALAAVTVPTTSEMWADRSSRVHGLLSRVVAGETIVVYGFTDKAGHSFEPQQVAVDPERPLYGVLGSNGGYVSFNTLCLWYDEPSYGRTEGNLGSHEGDGGVLYVGLRQMFVGNGILGDAAELG